MLMGGQGSIGDWGREAARAAEVLSRSEIYIGCEDTAINDSLIDFSET